jgi:catechol 2,3-dioxygenase-like lactoylglutathione lyase family enzyme
MGIGIHAAPYLNSKWAANSPAIMGDHQDHRQLAGGDFFAGGSISGQAGTLNVRLNHTIVRVRDKAESAAFLTEILGLPKATAYGPFLVVELNNDVSLDFADDHGPAHPQHYAFLVDESDFDDIFARIKQRGLTYWADPFQRRPGEFNTNDGGRGLYWEDPNGHLLEIITRPYGG